MRGAAASVALVLGLACWAGPAPADSTSANWLDAYAELPAYVDPQISPDGTRIAALRPVGGVAGLAVLDIVTGQWKVALAADPRRFRINFCRWASVARLVCQVRTSATIVGGRVPMRIAATALFAVDHDGSNARELLADTRARAWDRVHRGALIAALPDDPNHILVPLIDPEQARSRDYRRNRPQDEDAEEPVDEGPLFPDVYRLNVHDGTLTRVQRARDDVVRWFADDRGVVRIGVGRRDQRLHVVHVQDGRYTNLDFGPLASDDDIEFLHIATSGDNLLVAARGDADIRGVLEVDARTGKQLRVLQRDSRFDFAGKVQSLHGEPQGLLTSDDALRVLPLTARWTELLATLATLLPDGHAIPWSWDSRGQHFVVRAAPPRGPANWYYFDLAARRLARIGNEQPLLHALRFPGPNQPIQPKVRSAQRWLRYSARDGRTIPALLTTPEGAGKNLPTVVLPHGGPARRDGPEFDFVAEFLASRGYAVLQPQFRGSIGFGNTHFEAGFGQWGLAMQDDVLDGLAFLRAEGIAHPTAACIVGHSYGGYVGLIGSFRDKAQLRCSASYAGVADLPLLLRHRNLDPLDARSARSLLLATNRRLLEASSPAHNVAAIGLPILLVHGDRDVNVLVEQGRAFADALQRAGKAVRYVEQADADHHLGMEQHRREWLQELDAFLARWLAPSELAPSAR